MKKNILIICIAVFSLFMFTGCEKENDLNTEVSTKEFALSYQNVNILPGTKFNKSSISEEAAYSEIASCAFEGLDKVYTYNDLEITTADINGTETVFSVYFLTENLSTNEGIKITDTITNMIEKYGNDYDNFGKKYSYIKDEVELSFIIENDIITSIEYKYVVES